MPEAADGIGQRQVMIDADDGYKARARGSEIGRQRSDGNGARRERKT